MSKVSKFFIAHIGQRCLLQVYFCCNCWVNPLSKKPDDIILLYSGYCAFMPLIGQHNGTVNIVVHYHINPFHHLKMLFEQLFSPISCS